MHETPSSIKNSMMNRVFVHWCPGDLVRAQEISSVSVFVHAPVHASMTEFGGRREIVSALMLAAAVSLSCAFVPLPRAAAPPRGRPISLTATEVVDAADPRDPPQSGSEAWGTWKHSAEGIELRLELGATADGPVSAKGVRCEVVDGCLFAQLANEPAPLLFGRFRHEVRGSELSWQLDESEASGDEDARVLSIDIPWRRSPSELRQPGEAPGRIFDETLHVNGEPVLVAGLSCITVVQPGVQQRD